MTLVATLLGECLPGFSQYPSSAVSVGQIANVQTTAHRPLFLVCPLCSIHLSLSYPFLVHVE